MTKYKTSYRKSIYKRDNRREYLTWTYMRARCFNKNRPGYINYGDRGITICDRWLKSFDDFFIDMGPKPTEKHTLERIDNDGPYSPENCQWATRRDQNRNRTVSKWYTHNGETKLLGDWCLDFNMTYNIVYQRIKRGKSFIEAFQSS